MEKHPDSSSRDGEAQLLKKLQAFKIGGKDKAGRKILRIVGKYFPAPVVSGDGLRMYLEENVYPSLSGVPFSLLYVHTDVERAKNFPGISVLRSTYEAAPPAVKKGLHAIYFLHPGLQARFFFATFGRLLFGSGLCGKVRYITGWSSCPNGSAGWRWICLTLSMTTRRSSITRWSWTTALMPTQITITTIITGTTA